MITSSFAVGTYIRLVAESIQEGMYYLAINHQTILPRGFRVEVPGFRNWPYLYLRDQLLKRLVSETILVEEIFATLFASTWLQQLASRKFRGLTNEDVRGIEDKALAEHEKKIPGFTAVYTRCKNIIGKHPAVEMALRSYALNGPMEDLLHESFFPHTDDPDVLRQIPETLRQAELADAIRRIDAGEWESPRIRLLLALDACERIPREKSDLDIDDVRRVLVPRLPDVDDTVIRLKTPVSDLPFPYLGVKPRADRPMLMLSKWLKANASKRILLSYSPDLKGIDPDAQNSVEETLREGQVPFVYLEKVLGVRKYRFRKLYDDPKMMALCVDLLQAELLRAQLTWGDGLDCIFDLLDDVDHPIIETKDLQAHRRILQGLWGAFSPARNQTCDRWVSPSCI